MKKQIDEKILSLPPYLSTGWENVAALFLKGSNLVVDLQDGNQVQVPNLTDKEIEKIFHFHALFLEKLEAKEEPTTATTQGFGLFQGLPLQFSLEGLENISGAMEHNPNQSGFPTLPDNLLERIAELAKMISPEEAAGLNPPVEGCNCIYCQVSKALHKGHAKKETHAHDAPDVSDDDLHFEQWTIKQIKDQLFEVTNKLEPTEVYRVFLGDPIGCTCGKPNCEHIIAVLKS